MNAGSNQTRSIRLSTAGLSAPGDATAIDQRRCYLCDSRIALLRLPLVR